MTGALLGYLRHVLTAPITITGAETWRTGKMLGRETIVWFPKVLFVAEGALEYEIDGRTLTIPAGHLLYRPAWTRSQWTTTTRKLHMSFCEFDFPTAGLLWREPFVVSASSRHREAFAMQRIVELFEDASEEAILEAAGELKALLARTFVAASRQLSFTAVPPAPHPAIDHALQHLSQSFSRGDVLDDLHERAGLGINRFRMLFKQQLGLTPQAYVLLLRMRAARYYLTDARLPLKQVSLAVGYDDPLYFSRVYRKFWGHPPTHDRNRAATGARPPTPYTR